MSLHTSLDRSLLVPHRIHSNRLTASLLLTQPFQPFRFFIPPDLSIVAPKVHILPLGSGKLYNRVVPCDSTNTRVRGAMINRADNFPHVNIPPSQCRPYCPNVAAYFLSFTWSWTLAMPITFIAHYY